MAHDDLYSKLTMTHSVKVGKLIELIDGDRDNATQQEGSGQNKEEKKNQNIKWTSRQPSPGKDGGKRCPHGFAKNSLTCVHQSSSSLPSLEEVANADQSPIKAYAGLNEELERSGQEDWDKGGNTT